MSGPFRLTGAKRQLAERRLRARGLEQGEVIPRRAAGVPAPLSFGQRRLWLLDRWQPESPAYNLSVALGLDGSLDVSALGRSLAEVARRHEVLRARFPVEEDEPVQVIEPTATALSMIDLEGASPAEALTLATEEGRRPFDLQRGPVLRTLLLRLGERRHVLLLTLHHIAADGWSLGILVRETAALYTAFTAGLPSPFSELRIQYGDFAAWQGGRLQGEPLEKLLAFWRGQLADAPASLELPVDRPRPAARRARGASVPLALGPETSARLRDLAREQGATLFMALLAGFGALLHRYTGDAKVVIGSPVAGRSHPDTEDLIGFFVNSLALALDLGEDPTFAELLVRARETALAAFAHQELPFERLVEELRPERDPARTPVFQVMLVLQNAPMPPLALPGLTLSPWPVDGGTSKLDLLLSLTEGEQGLSGELTYDTDLLDRTTAERFARHLRRLLALPDPTARLAALPLLGELERHQLTLEWNDTSEEAASGTLAGFFSRQAARTPDRLAVAYADAVLTYSELDRRSDGLARFLASNGIGPEARVGILLGRSVEIGVALLGVWKAGASWVPLDPEWPAERLRTVREDASLALVLTRENLQRLGEGEHRDQAGRAPRPAGPDALAYVLYTSGSTGTPKGTLIRQGSVLSFARALAGSVYHGLEGPLQVSVNAPLTFDASIQQWVQLLEGHTLDVVPEGVRRDGAAFLAWLVERRIEVLDCTPAHLRMLLAAGLAEKQDLPLRRVIVGGEAIDPETWRALAGHPEIGGWNVYGPTECTVDSTHCAVASAPAPVIGRPLANVRVHVLDEWMVPAPIGVPGHLHVGGAGLARGYLGRPDLTAERFVPDPLGAEPGGRLYRTGDRAQLRADGALEFLGRLDRQLKHLGVRIEPGEIEAALVAHPAVRAAVVGLRHSRLVAWVAGEPVPPGELRSFLAARLPAAMVPALFVPIDTIPLTAHGKLDQRSLPDPEDAAPGRIAEGPRTPVEEVLAAIWSEVLGTGPVGRHDGFFSLGGHSLLATQAVSRIRRALGVELPLRELFEAPTVAALAPRIEDALRAGTAPAPPLRLLARAAGSPLSFAQERLWFLDRLEPGSAAYHIPAAFLLTGDLEPARLAAALSGVVARHEALRSSFIEAGGRPVQVVELAEAVPLPLGDLSALPPAAREAETGRRISAEVLRPFDLRSGPLVRALLLRLGEGEHAVVLTMHHIASDGWSRIVLLRDLAALYGGRPLPPLAIQYTDFAVWQRQWLTDEMRAAQIAWWREALSGLPPRLDLPADRPRTAVASPRGATAPVALSRELARHLEAFARREGASLFMGVLAAFEALLGRYSGREDVAVGVPLAGRNRAEIEELIGFFVNPVVVRLDLGGEPTFRELLGRAREATLGAYTHQDLPFELLVEALAPPREVGHTPLFQVMLAFQNTPGASPALPGLALAPLPTGTGTAKLDLILVLEEDLTGALEYRTDLYDAPTVQRLLGHLAVLLAAGADHPDLRVADLALLSEPESAQILREWNATVTAYPREASLFDLFARRAAAAPSSIALVQGETVWTYGELHGRAEALGGRLAALGLPGEARIAVLLDRSPLAIAAILGVLAAGAAYVPLDPAYPRDRLSFLLANSCSTAILTEARHLPCLPDTAATVLCLDGAPESSGGRPVRSGGDALAYVMYTSGSTGAPKGVAVPHRAVVRLVCNTGYARFGPDETILQLAPLSFDASTFEIWSALLHGGRLVLAPPGPPSPEGLAAAIMDYGITTLWLTAGLFHVLTEQTVARAAFSHLRQLLAGGDILSPPHVAMAITALAGGTLINGYGPTEGTTFSCCHVIRTAPPGPVPIGRPVANTRAWVLGRHLEALPTGVPGELYIAGDGLARGYLDLPGPTAERFLPDPFAMAAGERLYRTGDRARLLPDGSLDFLGRTDHQVKIRGFRVEPGEIETALLADPAVAGAAVVAVADAAGERSLAAFYTAADPDKPPSPDQLRARLQENLPAHLVPAAILLRADLPLNPNGKVDRDALGREAAGAPGAPGSASGEPRTPVEELLTGIWAEVLGLGQAGVHDDFFELGGHSLLAARAVARMREALGVEMPLRALFEFPTPAGLAEAVEHALRGGADAPVPPPITPVERTALLVPSFAQERLWFLDRLSPGSDAYNVPWALRLHGKLQPTHLAAALGAVSARHETLRMVFHEIEGRPAVAITPPGPFDLPVADLTALPGPRREAENLRLMDEEARRPFGLARGPLLRAILLRLVGEEHLLLLTLHHAVCDGGSMPILLREALAGLWAIAEDRHQELPVLPVQYADYAAWQRRWLAGDILARELGWWRERLAGVPHLLDLPLDRPRPRVRRPRGAVCSVELPAHLTSSLATLGRQRGATPFMMLLAAFSALLSRHSGQEDLCIGFPVAGRGRVEIENLIGLFVNTLVARADLSGDPPFAWFLAHMREQVLAAYAHQDVPFERLVEELAPRRDLSLTPLFQVLFVHQGQTGLAEPFGAVEIPGLTAEPAGSSNAGTAKLDLTLVVAPRGPGLAVTLDYDASLFDRATALRLLGHWQTLLAAIADAPEARLSDLPLLTPPERAQLLAEWSGAGAVVEPKACLHEWIEAQVDRTPEAVALVAGRVELTYAELDAAANRLAHRLRGLGAGPETPVAVCLGRTAELVVTLLAVLKAGAAYVPLDPRYPSARLELLLADSRAALMVTERRWLSALPESPPLLCLDEEDIASEGSGRPAIPVLPGNLAYVIYTSGSTGVPKGVGIEHRSAASLVAWAREAFPSALEAVLAATSVCFDLSVFEIFAPLAVGGRVVLVEDALSAGSALAVTLVNTVPSALAELVRSGGVPPAAATFILAGEPLLRPLVDALHELEPPRTVLNLYGPTETTTYSTKARMARGDSRPPAIGRPLPGERVHLLDRHLFPVPAGVAGEILIGGDGLARGYLGRPDGTASRFVPDPFGEDGSRLYRTGDLARWRPDGELELLGRIDGQVKLRGFRIEPGEVEAALLAYPGVTEATVVVREARLVAYLAPVPTEATATGLRGFLAERLPAYLLPSAILRVDALPRTANGKVDRAALPAPEGRSIAAHTVSPSGPTEEELARIWGELLGIETVGADDSFFDLGGHSLLGAQLLARLRGELRVDLPLQVLFEAPTIAALAVAVERAKQETGFAFEAIPRVSGDRDAEELLSRLDDLSDDEVAAILREMS